MRRICVFCGSLPGANPAFAAGARALGRLLAARRIGLVYGGGSVGLMGAVADAVLDAGGEAIGVIPQALCRKEIAHTGLSELHVVDTMHQRKALMAELSDAFIALPGGIGTLEELFEVWTWAQLGLHRKPLGLLNLDAYFDPLTTFLERMVAMGFLQAAHHELVLVDTEAERLLARLAAYRPLAAPKWIDLPHS